MGRKKTTGLPTMPMVINVVRVPTETAKKKANGYNTLRTVTKKVKPVSEMGYMKATIFPTMRMVTGDMKASMASTKGILMMAKSKVNSLDGESKNRKITYKNGGRAKADEFPPF